MGRGVGGWEGAVGAGGCMRWTGEHALELCCSRCFAAAASDPPSRRPPHRPPRTLNPPPPLITTTATSGRRGRTFWGGGRYCGRVPGGGGAVAAGGGQGWGALPPREPGGASRLRRAAALAARLSPRALWAAALHRRVRARGAGRGWAEGRGDTCVRGERWAKRLPTSSRTHPTSPFHPHTPPHSPTHTPHTCATHADYVGETVPLEAPWRIRGPVVRGFGRGSRELGIPTANLAPEALRGALGEAVTGIYAGWASVGAEARVYKFAMSVGWNPVFANKVRVRGMGEVVRGAHVCGGRRVCACVRAQSARPPTPHQTPHHARRRRRQSPGCSTTLSTTFTGRRSGCWCAPTSGALAWLYGLHGRCRGVRGCMAAAGLRRHQVHGLHGCCRGARASSGRARLHGLG